MQFDTLAAAADHMQVQQEHLQQQLQQYNEAAAAGSDALGKQYFPTKFDTAGRLWVGQITPVVHYCMGGLEINDKAQVSTVHHIRTDCAVDGASVEKQLSAGGCGSCVARCTMVPSGCTQTCAIPFGNVVRQVLHNLLWLDWG